MWREHPSEPAEFRQSGDAAVVVLDRDPERKPGLVQRSLRLLGCGIGWTAWLLKSLLSVSTLILTLAVIAATPVLQFLALGYMLEAAARLARTGRWSHCLPGLHRVGRFGAILLGIWLCTLPGQLLAGALADSRLIDPTSRATERLEILTPIVGVMCLLHAILAAFRGRLLYFARPLNNLIWLRREWRAGNLLKRRWKQFSGWLRSLRLWYYFSLGFRGFCGAAFWLFIPATLLAVGRDKPLFGFLGGLLMAVVVCWLPFLQLNFAVENRFSAMFEIRHIRQLFRKSPIAFLVVFLLTLVLAVPLYLLKIEEVPRDAIWLLALLFIVTILPLKIAVGWAYGRSIRQESTSWRIVAWPCRLLMAPVAILYTYIIFLTQYTGWHGALSLYEHHAFLLPVPF